MMRWRKICASHSAREKRCAPASWSNRCSETDAVARGAPVRRLRRGKVAGLSLVITQSNGSDSCAPPVWPPAPSGRAPRGGRTRRGKLLEVADDLLEHRGDHRPSAEM